MSADLAARYPRTFEGLRALPGGEASLHHLEILDRGFRRRPAGITVAEDGPGRGAMDFDVALAGGGLSLIYAAYLARAGWRVVVFDRGRIGRSHREWNISRRELRPLVESGLFSDDEVERLILTQYDHGIVRWHGGGTHVVREVLDCVVDTDALLVRLRAIAGEAGAVLLDGHRMTGYRVGLGGVEVSLAPPEGDRGAGRVRLTTRLLVDAMGSMSPHARFDLVCPTVGGVLDGLDIGDGPDEMDPKVGEILASTEGIEEGRQHIWEAFPGPSPGPSIEDTRGGRAAVYLFYYCEPDTLGEHPLFELYERFFRLRARYKRGDDARLEKATYGYIPAYTRLRNAPTAPSDRVILVGDAAGRHSPLTFCGFGSMIRSFRPVADSLRARLERDRLSRRALSTVWSEPPCLRLFGALALMMVPFGERGAFGPPRGDMARQGPDEINKLLDAAFATLASMGQELYAQLVRDEIDVRDFREFMRRTSLRRPTIYREVFQHLTPPEIAVWSAHLVGLLAKSYATSISPVSPIGPISRA